MQSGLGETKEQKRKTAAVTAEAAEKGIQM